MQKSYQKISRLSKRGCKFNAHIRVLKAELDDEIDPDMVTFQVGMKCITIFRKSSCQDNSPVTTCESGPRHASAVPLEAQNPPVPEALRLVTASEISRTPFPN